MSTQTLTGPGAGTPVLITGKTLSPVLPGFLCLVSGTLTYNVEATGNAVGTDPTTWSWTPLSNFTGLTASTDGALLAMATHLRPNVTAFTSGSLVFQVIQPSAK